jgi:hypothetical protein
MFPHMKSEAISQADGFAETPHDHAHVWAKEGCWCGAKRCTAMLRTETGMWFRTIRDLLEYQGFVQVLACTECTDKAINDGRCEAHQ